MLRVHTCSVAVLAIVFSSFASSPSVAQTDDPPPGNPLQINVRNVLVDVVVTDKQGTAVPHLRKEDFQVFENGKPQNVEFFEPHFPAAPSVTPAANPLPPNTFTNVPRVQPNEAINILLMDALNTTSGDQMYVRRQMLKYLEYLPPDLRIGVFLLGDRLRIIQGFTADSNMLRASIQHFTNKSTLVASEATPQELAAQSTSLNDLYTLTADPGGIQANGGSQLAGMVSQLQSFLDVSTEVQKNQQLLMTLDALEAIARYASAMPGRKNLIWFIGSFSLCLPELTETDAYSKGCPYEDRVEKTLNALAAARVSVYPIDAGGVFAPNAEIGGAGGNQAGSLVPGTTIPLPQGAASSFHSSEEASNDPYFKYVASEAWAQATGGKASHHNDLKAAIAEDVRNGSSYYTLAYIPRNSKEIGRLRKVEVRLPSSNYRLSYRRAYFEPTLADLKAAVSREHDSLRPLMDRGMPDFADLHYNVRIEPSTDQPPAGAPANGDNPKLKPPLNRYTVRFFLSTKGLNLVQGRDGIRRAPIEVALVAYSQSGESLNWMVRSVNLAVRPDQLAIASSSGIPFHFDFAMPPGDVYLRSGIYDPSTQRAGTLEIPQAALVPVPPQSGGSR